MSLDGLRAWIGEVERKLGMRTRVFLVLTTIAIGCAGAGIYLAIDTRNNAVSESDVQALQEQLEARIGAGGAGTAATDSAQLEVELRALQAQVEQLSGEDGGSEQSKGNGASSAPGGESEGGESSPEGGGSEPSGAAPNKAKLRELLESAKEQSEENE